MRTFSQLRPADWLNDHFQSIYRKAGPAAFYLWIALLSGPDSHSTGLMRVRVAALAQDADLSEAQVESTLDALAHTGFLSWDCDNCIILLHGEFARQNPISASSDAYQPTDNRIRGAYSHARNLGASPVAKAFVAYLDALVGGTGDTETERDTEGGASKPLPSPFEAPSIFIPPVVPVEVSK